ncbi:hypothetical protein [Leifsonia sp. Root112D2]|uniref:hypothetical protein n=1 Tax=Leifsonia sp. Root112D2 TaxID=1736426 RepID=UPI0006F8165A|nr:hypothetical protein [Leifsonia sp. Root112D2]KQV06613.1 hypothetical protein ASC63_04115 [Leifsonia sp. Root112D2]
MTTEHTPSRHPGTRGAVAPGLRATNPNPVSTHGLEPIPVVAPSTDAAIEAARARARLATTLTSLEDKLNPRKQLTRLRHEHPVASAAAATVLASLAVAAVWAGVRAVRRR